MSSYSRQQLENFASKVVIEARDGTALVLDIGGSQLPIENRVAKIGDVRFEIMDLPNPHEEKQKAQYICDIQDTDTISKLNINDRFMFAFCFEVSEYWLDPLNALKNIHSTLKQNGILMISFHFIYPLHKPTGYDFLRYTRYGAIKLLEKAGFRIVSYQARNMNHPATAKAFFRSEGFKPDRDESEQHLLEQGCIIVAEKI